MTALEAASFIKQRKRDMLQLFILFILAGIIIGLINKDDTNAMLWMAAIVFLSFLLSGFWAIATAIELYFGFKLARTFYKPQKDEV